MDLIRLINGNDCFVSDKDQFALLVRDSMGDDAWDYLYGLFNDYEQKICNLESDIDSMQDDINSIDGRIEENDEEIRELEEEIDKLNDKNKELENKLQYKIERIKTASEINRYKIVGNHDTYNQYNEGWQDCVDYVDSDGEY